MNRHSFAEKLRELAYDVENGKIPFDGDANRQLVFVSEDGVEVVNLQASYEFGSSDAGESGGKPGSIVGCNCTADEACNLCAGVEVSESGPAIFALASHGVPDEGKRVESGSHLNMHYRK